MLFSHFSTYLSKLEKTSSRLEITSILSELFKEASQSDVKEVVYLSLGILAPNYESILLNLAEKMVLKSIAIGFDKDLEEVAALYKKEGDAGNVAQTLSVTSDELQVKTITVTEVFQKLVAIAKDGGEGSQDRKIEMMAELLKSLDPLSVKFVARIPVGRLRLGFSEKTIIDALSSGSKEKAVEIENAYNIRPDIGFIAELVKKGKLNEITPKLGVPVVPMLCTRINSYQEMIKKMGEVSVEPKFDGLRIFIHYRKSGGFLKIFTRNMNYLDPKIFPELEKLSESINAEEVILDSEAVGLDAKREIFVDFQKTISRRRKHDVEKSSNDTPLQFQVFDILLADGKSLIDEPYINRRKVLEEKVINGNLLRVDENIVTTDPEVIQKMHEKYLKMGLEGVVVKRANGKYVSGRTGWNWVKMKEEEGQDGRLSDTIDCVVMGYFLGKGKRAQFGIGKILVGVRDGDRVLTLTKVGTGLSEDMLVDIKNKLDKITSISKPKEYEASKDLTPDVWVMPGMVVEVAADSISKSTKHSLGFSLRFPKFIKIRSDKGLNEATTLKEIKDMSKMV